MDKYIRMLLSELIKPKDGTVVFLNRYWSVTESKEVLFYRDYSHPQCNSNKELCDRISGINNTVSKFVPVAYVPINWDHR